MLCILVSENWALHTDIWQIHPWCVVSMSLTPLRLTLPAFVLSSVLFVLKQQQQQQQIWTFFLFFYDLLSSFLLLSFCFVFLASLQLFYLVAADVEHLSCCILSWCFVFVLFFSYCSTAYKETVIFFLSLFFLLYIHPHWAIFLQSRLPALHPWVNKCLAWMVYCIIFFFALSVHSKNTG